MRKSTYLLIILICFTGCSFEKQAESTAELDNSKKSESSIDDLLTFYSIIDFDTLHVHSDNESHSYDSDSYRFKGKQIDSSYFSLFPKDIQDLLYAEPLIYAVYKIDIDENHVGLITRTPAEYVPNSVKLLVFNKNTKQFTETFDLADSWGDAGDSMIRESWLYKNEQNGLEWFYIRQDCSYETEEAEQPECWDFLAVFKANNGRINPIPRDSSELRRLSRAFKI